MGRPRKNRFPLDLLAYKSGCAYFDVLYQRWVPDWPMLAQAVGSTLDALHKQDGHGGLIASRAEVYACRCGLNPMSVWGEGFYDELDEQIRSDEEALAS